MLSSTGMAGQGWKILVCVVLLDFLDPSVALLGNSSLPNYRLLHDLLDGYDPAVCPKKSVNEPVTVTIQYVLMSLNVVDEQAQSVTINGFLNLNWTDAFLQWDPALYEGLDMLVIPATRVWIPDAAFQNGIDKLFYDYSNFAVNVYSDGSVFFTPGGAITLSCSLNLTTFPFDTQTCTLQVVPWTTPERTMKYIPGNFTTDLSTQNGEWTILDLSVNYDPWTSEGEVYSEIFMYLLIKRKPWYQVMNTIVPVIMLSILNLAVFRLAPDSGEKVSLSITVLLAYSVWLLMTSSMMPVTSDHLPLIGTFITILMGISTLSVFMTVYIIGIHHTDDSQPVPDKLKTLLRFCRRRRARTHSIKQVDYAAEQDTVSEEKITWQMVALATDRACFYSLLVITIILLIAAFGKISSMVVHQPSSLK